MEIAHLYIRRCRREFVQDSAGHRGEPSNQRTAHWRGHIGVGELSRRVPRTLRAEFIAKIGVCCEEADETKMWLNLCADAGLSGRSVITSLADEPDQLLRILTASQLTAKRRNQPS